MTEQHCVLQEVNVPEGELGCLVDNLSDFLKTSVQDNNSLQVPISKPKMRLDLYSQNTISLLSTVKISLNIQVKNLASFPLKFETTR